MTLITFKIHQLTDAGQGRVKAVLKSSKYEPSGSLTLTAARTNDLVIGCKIGDEILVKLERKTK